MKKLAAKITKGKKTVQAKARAIYDWTCANMYRDPDTRGCGKGDVCALLSKPGGKCTDISSMFIALARASGVPAREVFGIRLGKKAEEDITGYQHCWAEFFQPGYGWVPVDPADVRKAMLVEKLSDTDPKTAEYKTCFWGGIDPYRIKLKEMDAVKLVSRSNPDGIEGKVRISRLVRPGCVAVSFHYGHTQFGASGLEIAGDGAQGAFLGGEHVVRDGKLIPDARYGAGLNSNMLSQLDSNLGDTPLVDLVAGIPDFSNTRVKVVKV